MIILALTPSLIDCCLLDIARLDEDAARRFVRERKDAYRACFETTAINRRESNAGSSLK